MVVVADQNIKAFVHVWYLAELMMYVAAGQRCYGCIEAGCVAQPCVTHASRENVRNTTDVGATVVREASVLWSHFSGSVDFGASDVAVHINAAWKYDSASQVDRTNRIDVFMTWRATDFAVANPNVFDFTIDVTCWIVDSPAS